MEFLIVGLIILGVGMFFVRKVRKDKDAETARLRARENPVPIIGTGVGYGKLKSYGRVGGYGGGIPRRPIRKSSASLPSSRHDEFTSIVVPASDPGLDILEVVAAVEIVSEIASDFSSSDSSSSSDWSGGGGDFSGGGASGDF